MLLDKDKTISIIIPTLNAEAHIKKCLLSIKKQDYPKEKIEILIIDGSSSDNTVEIAKKYGAKIHFNPLKTSESAKMIGVKESIHELILFIDADNILPEKKWLLKMIKPLLFDDAIGSEPIRFTYRKEDYYINRYCALIGLNDPLCYYLGNYDKYNFINGSWTKIPVNEYKKEGYKIIEFSGERVATLGANGCLFKKELVKNLISKDAKYLFDNDIFYFLLKNKRNKFAKVDVGIIHDYSTSLKEFIKKQDRRIKDYLYFSRKGQRQSVLMPKLKIAKFCLYTILILPLFIDSLRGYLRKKDRAWFFHIVACFLTLIIYAKTVIVSMFFKTPTFKNRISW